MDEFCSKEGAVVPPSFREQSSPGLTAGTNQIKIKTEASPAAGESEEPLVHLKLKWRYMVRLIQWHLTEELLVPSVLIEWLSNQLQVLPFESSIDIKVYVSVPIHLLKLLIYLSPLFRREIRLMS